MHNLFSIHQLGEWEFQNPHVGFSCSFFRINDSSFNNCHNYKMAGRQSLLRHRWRWHPSLALCIYLCLTAAKWRLILQLVARAAHVPPCVAGLNPAEFVSNSNLGPDLHFRHARSHLPMEKEGNFWGFLNSLQKIKGINKKKLVW